MEYKIHKVEADEKLKSISEKYNISIKDIKKVNPNIRFFKSILGTEYVACLQTLKIPVKENFIENESSKSIEKKLWVEENENLDYDFSKPQSFTQYPLLLVTSDEEYSYEIVQKQSLSLHKKHLYEAETKMIWELSDIIVSKEYFTLRVKQKQHKLEQSHSILKDLSNFAQLFNIPLANLHLKFSIKGKFLSILNQNEIKENWEKLKSTQLKELLENEETKDIIKGGDKDFTNSEILIKNNFLYQLIFPMIYGSMIISEHSTPSEPIFCRSNIFQNQIIKLNIQRKNTKTENKVIETLLVGENPTEKKNIDKLEKIFENQFKEIVKEKFNYKFSFTSNYDINEQTGIIQRVVSTMSEKLSNNFIHKSEYIISLITKENE